MPRRNARKRKERRGVYSVDVQKYSIYPRIQKPTEYTTPAQQLRPGKTIEVDIIDVDEKNRGIAKYGNYQVLVLGQATVGDRVKVKIEQIRGNTIIASILSMKKSDIEY